MKKDQKQLLRQITKCSACQLLSTAYLMNRSLRSTTDLIQILALTTITAVTANVDFPFHLNLLNG